MRVNMSKQPPPAPTTSAVGPCPTVIQIVGRPSAGSLPSTIAPPDHPPPPSGLEANMKIVVLLPDMSVRLCLRQKILYELGIIG